MCNRGRMCVVVFVNFILFVLASGCNSDLNNGIGRRFDNSQDPDPSTTVRGALKEFVPNNSSRSQQILLHPAPRLWLERKTDKDSHIDLSHDGIDTAEVYWRASVRHRVCTEPNLLEDGSFKQEVFDGCYRSLLREAEIARNKLQQTSVVDNGVTRLVSFREASELLEFIASSANRVTEQANNPNVVGL
jgi:hypothetical protein